MGLFSLLQNYKIKTNNLYLFCDFRTSEAKKSQKWQNCDIPGTHMDCS